LAFVSLFGSSDRRVLGLEVTNGAKALRTSEKAPVSNKQLGGLPIGLRVSLGTAKLKGVKLEEEQLVGFSFTNERCFLTDVPGVSSSSFRCSRFTRLQLDE